MIIWIASYPRSGNTWIRSFLSTYLYSKKGNTVFENIKKITNFPNKNHFQGIFEINEFSEEELKDKKKKDKKKFEISKYWVTAQKKINLNKEITFLKTHNFACRAKNCPIGQKVFRTFCPVTSDLIKFVLRTLQG